MLVSLMGTGEVSSTAQPSNGTSVKEVRTPTKSNKPIVSTQESSLIASSQADWLACMQTYYPAGAAPPPFATSSIASSPAFLPYFWGNQQQVQQYGTPLQYPTLYHHRGFYGYPSVVGDATLAIPKEEEKTPNEKDLDLLGNCKRSSESAGFRGNRSGKRGKVASANRNDGDGAAQSAASDNEGSSDESDETIQDLSVTKKQRYNQIHADGSTPKNNVEVQHHGAHPDSMLQDSAENIDETTLNSAMSQNASDAKDNLMKDENELKKERRKQSNRESAKRSRLRKQQECERLQAAVKELREETSKLKNELMDLSEECQKLGDENRSIVEELEELYGPDVVSDLVAINGESNSNIELTQSERNSTPDQNRDTSRSDLS